MSDLDVAELLNQLEDLLDRERLALLGGNLDAISRLAEQKEVMFRSLEGLSEDARSELSVLRTKAERNHVLLDGALQGIRAVAARVAAVRKTQRSLETYDAAGRKQTIEGVVQHKVERRA